MVYQGSVIKIPQLLSPALAVVNLKPRLLTKHQEYVCQSVKNMHLTTDNITKSAMHVIKIAQLAQDNKNSIALNVLMEKKKISQVTRKTLSTVSILVQSELTKINKMLATHAIKVVSLVQEHRAIIALHVKNQ